MVRDVTQLVPKTRKVNRIEELPGLTHINFLFR